MLGGQYEVLDGLCRDDLPATEVDAHGAGELFRHQLPELVRRGFARNTIRLAIATLRAVLNSALEDGLIAANPAVRLGKFAKTEKLEHEASALSQAEVERMLKAALDSCPQHYPMLLTAVRAGLRRGELVALRWGDIQFGESEDDPHRYILVQRSFDQRWSRKFTLPKNRKSRRVDMSRELRRVLLEVRDARMLEAFAAGRSSIADDLVFPSEVCTVIEMNNFVARTFVPLLEWAGLRKVRFHDLRHTYGSLLIQAGASLAYVRDQMGHHSIQVTVDVYGHLVPSATVGFVDLLDRGRGPEKNAPLPHLTSQEGEGESPKVLQNQWLGGRDSNPDTQIQSLQSYR